MYVNEAPNPVREGQGGERLYRRSLQSVIPTSNENQFLKSCMMIPQIITSAMFFCLQWKIWLLAKTLSEICINNGYYYNKLLRFLFRDN